MIKSSCGFDCSLCPLYQASHEQDTNLRTKIEEKYNLKKHMNCDGCLSDNCAEICSMCNIKKCCSFKDIENCGWCDDLFECNKIKIILDTNEESKKYLIEENKKYQEEKICQKY